jgi:hypothetical protein
MLHGFVVVFVKDYRYSGLLTRHYYWMRRPFVKNPVVSWWWWWWWWWLTNLSLWWYSLAKRAIPQSLAVSQGIARHRNQDWPTPMVVHRQPLDAHSCRPIRLLWHRRSTEMLPRCSLHSPSIHQISTSLALCVSRSLHCTYPRHLHRQWLDGKLQKTLAKESSLRAGLFGAWQAVCLECTSLKTVPAQLDLVVVQYRLQWFAATRGRCSTVDSGGWLDSLRSTTRVAHTG